MGPQTTPTAKWVTRPRVCWIKVERAELDIASKICFAKRITVCKSYGTDRQAGLAIAKLKQAHFTIRSIRLGQGKYLAEVEYSFLFAPSLIHNVPGIKKLHRHVLSLLRSHIIQKNPVDKEKIKELIYG